MPFGFGHKMTPFKVRSEKSGGNGKNSFPVKILARTTENQKTEKLAQIGVVAAWHSSLKKAH
jgi:hypothetical protein